MPLPIIHCPKHKDKKMNIDNGAYLPGKMAYVNCPLEKCLVLKSNGVTFTEENTKQEYRLEPYEDNFTLVEILRVGDREEE